MREGNNKVMNQL